MEKEDYATNQEDGDKDHATKVISPDGKRSENIGVAWRGSSRADYPQYGLAALDTVQCSLQYGWLCGGCAEEKGRLSGLMSDLCRFYIPLN